MSSASDTETVSLNLDGSFEEQAKRDAAAAQKVAADVAAMQAAMDKLKPPTWNAAAHFDVMSKGAEQSAKMMEKLRAASAKAGGTSDGVLKGYGGNGLPASLKASASNQVGGFAQLVGKVGDTFGPAAAEKLVQGAGLLSKAAPILGPVGGAIATGGKVLLGAATALVAAAAGMTAAFLKFGIETSAKAQLQREVFTKLGGNYDVAIQIAGKYGIDADNGAAMVKKLLGAKFKNTDVDAILRVSVGIGAVMGEEKGKAFIEKMTQQMNKGGKATEETIKGFAEAGVYKTLAAKLGISIDQAKAKVKSGAIDMKTALDAVKEAAGKDFGGIADKVGGSVPSILLRIKNAITKLFSNFDLGPLKGALKNIEGVLTGPTGKAMGEAFTKLGNTLIKTLFGPLDGASGKSKLEAVAKFITRVVNGITATIVAAKPYAAAAMAFIKDLFAPKPGSDGLGTKIRELGKVLGILLTPAMISTKALIAFGTAVWPIVKLPLGVAMIVASAGFRVLSAVLGAVFSPLAKVATALGKLLGIADEAGASAGGIGTAIVDGILGGLEGGLDAVLSAAGNLASGALNKIKSVLGVASPAKALIFVGDMMASGMAGGMNDGAGKSAAAGEKMAAKALGGAAKGAAGKRGGAGAGGGGEQVIINVTVQAAPGMSKAEAKAIGDEGGEASYAAWQRNKRRDAREQGRAA